MRFAVPLGLFAILVVILAIGLTLDPRRVPSPLIDKPAPEIDLPKLHTPGNILRKSDLAGRVVLLNVWASWCGACRVEHPLLIELARSNTVEIVGLNYKDKRGAALQWLQELGDPYTVSAFDEKGHVGLNFGVYGVPETFVIDAAGVIRYKHIGPISADQLRDTILPLIQRLRGAAS